MIALTNVAAGAADAPEVGLDELTGRGAVVVLAPHPDDESLAMGGAIAAAVAAGHCVHVVVVTDGSHSHPASRSHPPSVLADLRRAEVTEAVRILTGGAHRPTWLGWPDMAAPDDALDFAAVSWCLDPLFDTEREPVTAIWTTWSGDPHPDHQRTWRLARHLADTRPGTPLFACPVWGRVQPPVPGAPTDGLRRFPHPHRALKARAVAAHVSQMTGLIDDDPDGFRMPEDLARHFVEADEIFIPT